MARLVERPPKLSAVARYLRTRKLASTGSVTPVTYLDWRQGVSTMMLRESKASGRVSDPDQRIDLARVLRS